MGSFQIALVEAGDGWYTQHFCVYKLLKICNKGSLLPNEITCQFKGVLDIISFKMNIVKFMYIFQKNL